MLGHTYNQYKKFSYKSKLEMVIARTSVPTNTSWVATVVRDTEESLTKFEQKARNGKSQIGQHCLPPQI